MEGLRLPAALALLALLLATLALEPALAEVYASQPLYVVDHAFRIKAGFPVSAAWSPDGSTLAVAVNVPTKSGAFKGALYVYSQGEVKVLEDLPASLTDVKWGPGGLLAYGYAEGLDTGVAVVDPGVGLAAKVKVRVKAAPDAVAWAPEAPGIAVATGGGVRLYELGNEGLVEAWRARVDGASRVYWSPDGGSLLVLHGGAATLLGSGGEKLWSAKVSSNGFVVRAEWSPDGALVAVGVENRVAPERLSAVAVLDAATGRELWRVEEGGGVLRVIYGFHWGPQGRLLVYGDSLAVFNGDGSLEFKVEVAKGAVKALTPYTAAWSPSGEMIAANPHGDLLLVDAARGEALGSYQLLENQNQRTDWILWAPGSLAYVHAVKKGLVAVFREPGQGELAVLEIDPAGATLEVRASDGVIAKRYTTKGEPLTLYATPGTYTLEFAMKTLPGNVKKAGPVQLALAENPPKAQLEVELGPGEAKAVKAPLADLLAQAAERLAVAEVRGPKGATLTFTYLSGAYPSEYKVTLESSTEQVYLAPGQYKVNYQLPTGEQGSLGEIKVAPGDKVTLELPTAMPPQATTTEQPPAETETETQTQQETTTSQSPTDTTPPTTGTTAPGTTTTTEEARATGETGATSPEQPTAPEQEEGGATGTTTLAIAAAALIILVAAGALLALRRR